MSKKSTKKPAKRKQSVHELAKGFADKSRGKLLPHWSIDDKRSYWLGAYKGYSAGLRDGRKGK